MTAMKVNPWPDNIEQFVNVYLKLIREAQPDFVVKLNFELTEPMAELLLLGRPPSVLAIEILFS